MSSKRKVISLELKMQIIRRVEAGERKSHVAQSLGLAQSTIKTILNQAEKVKDSVQNCSGHTAYKLTRTRGSIIEKMEKMLGVWVDDMTQRNAPLTQTVIQRKALTLFHQLKEQESEKTSETFVASRGWFEKFKKRATIHSLRRTDEAASAGAMKFVADLQEVIERGRYPPNLVFNVDESVIYWKRLPSKTVIPHCASRKKRLTLMMGANASGDMKLKPLLVYHAETNRRAWVTIDLFTDWFLNQFCPSVQRYCAQRNLEPKALLILDNAPGHPSNLGSLQTCIPVEVMFLPPNTTSILQPMDQGVKAALKANYLKRAFTQMSQAKDNEAIAEFWKNYDITDAITNIKAAWNELKYECLNSVWREVWFNIVMNCEAIDNEITAVCTDVVVLALATGSNEVDLANVLDLLKSQGETLTNDELLELMEQQVISSENDERPLVPIRPKKELTATIVTSCLNEVRHALEILSENDPDFARSCGVKRTVLEALNCYSAMIYNKKPR
ncbi:PREDICTED: tigger transposable element-derived protein 1-like [Nicrophorus vespilloides]|uniref:Tigger transposable element-derived protein 1-like n=1 Tax=Nicrophorus vespilloides TaxID=110193 RepID=A0ABM1NDM3_NICVS|nr:PREDICTED: tigger transposable element-derived protein 1-like [Nicrophorus vespilloides]